MNEPEYDTPHTRDHNVEGGLAPHEHLHGTGDGQHAHSDWEPSRVVRRMQRDGFCAAPVGQSYCMALAPCKDHP